MAYTTWQMRRGTAGAWTTAAAVLADGEIGYETDTGKFKIGDGSTAWGSLTYFEAGAGGGSTNTILNGSGVPGGGTGDNDDFYIDTTNDNIYGPKTGAGWGAATSLVGPAGAAGTNAVTGLVKAKGNLSSVSYQNVENDIRWASPVITDASVSVSSSELTINTTGTYKFTVTLRTDSANRTELFIRTYFDTGGGWVQDTDAIVSDYVSRDTDQDTGSVTLIDVFELDSGDKVEFRGFGDCDGTCVGLDAGTVLIVERLA